MISEREVVSGLYELGYVGTSLVVQKLGLRASNARGEGLIPGWGAKLPHASWPKKQT